jgi:gliding motility-associated protein GldM
MGATNCPETPRQRMIQMMYLVLTALLALNVSKEILDSFLIVNESLITTNENFTRKIEGSYASFDQQKSLNEAKVLPFWKKAQTARQLTKDLIAYIQKVRATVISKEGKISVEEADTINIRNVSARDKYDEGTAYMIGNSDDGSAGEAAVLKNKIIEYKKAMIELLNPKYRKTIETNFGLNVEGPFYDADHKAQNWEVHSFYRTILAANVVILNKTIAEVKNAEFDVVSQLYSEVSVADFKFDQIGAKIVPKSNYVLSGESFEADIFVAAYDSKQNPVIKIGSGVDSSTYAISGEVMNVDAVNGVGKLKMAAGGMGIRQYGGVITVPSGDGLKSYPFSGEYIVAQPSATISPTKMNVFYIGVDNPVSISVPGVANDKVRVNISGGGGSITKTGNGLYNVRVTTQGACKVSVSAELGGGSSRSMGGMDFRVKKVPDPVAYIGGVKSGPIGKGVLSASCVIPKMEAFDFELSFRITSFSLSMNLAGDFVTKSTSGNCLSGEMKSMIDKAGRGQKIYIEDIKAVGPDGTTRTLAPINLKIN